MISKVLSCALSGIEAYPIDIEVDVSIGLPAVNIIGLADTSIKESKERVKAAIKNSGFHWPAERITISLAPSDQRKDGSGFDLAIALGILAATRQINISNLDKYFVLAELSLNGALRATKGSLPISMALSALPIKNIIVPADNAKEAALVAETNVFALKTLRETVEFLDNPGMINPYKTDLQELFCSRASYEIDFSEVRGQYFAKRALEVAVAGGHHILMIGPPGSGKSMLAKRISTIMPQLSSRESLEITKIHSAAGSVPVADGIIATRPFRMPHHSLSQAALVGGGSIPAPGEICLAHQGVLFLDELPEFNRNCLEALRQPLEDGSVRISRANKSFVFPSSFMLVCAMNPCPCGYYGDRQKPCRCNPAKIQQYISKISGPLLDRIDIHIEVPAARYQELSSNLSAESSERIRERINKARLVQRERFLNEQKPIFHNAQMSHKQVRKFCLLGKEESELLKMAMLELALSARAYDKILRVSRTIADLAGSELIEAGHLSEAIQYRNLDRQW